MALATFDETRFDATAEVFSGRLLRPGDDGYDEARRVHNGMVDKHPALIARCRGTADVADAVRLARECGLEISVRGGGHNVAGHAVADGALMIDLAPMSGIQVDAAARRVRAQGGVTWRELNRETAVHGLAVTGGAVSTTGIAGLTLGGGLGWLMGKHGLAADNVVAIELVTADAEVLTATADEHADLFWALRGGGGNFGVATWFEYRLHPVAQVTGGIVAHPLRAGNEALRFFREFSRTIPDDLSVMPAFIHAPDGSGTPLFAFAICHAGSAARAEADLRELVAYGSPVLAQVGPMSYPAVNMMLDGGFPKGALNYWKSSFLRALSDDAIDAMVDGFASCPSPMTSMPMEHFHGAVTRVGVTDTAVPHREPGFNVVIASVWTDPAEADANVRWTRAMYDALGPDLAGRRYVNYLDHDDRGDAVQDAYGPNLARLGEAKRKYDPENVFRRNPNIAPAP
jgi:FAD binding domain/Berberine and berberine like